MVDLTKSPSTLMKKDLITMAGISTNAMAKMGKEENVSTEVLGKICAALHCRIEDIVEFVPEEKQDGEANGKAE